VTEQARRDDHNSAIEALTSIVGELELGDGTWDDDDIVAGVQRLRAERDRLQADADAIQAFLNDVLGEPDRPAIDRITQFVAEAGRNAMALIDERDRFRAALRMIAIPPVHVPDLSEGCEGCAGVARAALDGTDYRGRVAKILANEMARIAVIEAAKRWYAASDLEELGNAVDDLKAAVAGLLDAWAEEAET
jgi:hypothetical protein